MRYARLIGAFMRASAQQEMAYRLNFFVNLLEALLNLGVGLLSIQILFGQVSQVRGWSYAQTLALLGVYLGVGALRNLFIGPSLEALAGMGQEIATGSFDFALLRPLDTQFLVTFRYWRLFSLVDLALGVGVIGYAVSRLAAALTPLQVAGFLACLGAGVVVLYALLLALTTLVFWSPGFLFTWVFDALFQMARYPVGIYPGWLRLALTWVIPVGIITTLPVQALTGAAPAGAVWASLGVAGAALAAASAFFRAGLRRYASASS